MGISDTEKEEKKNWTRKMARMRKKTNKKFTCVVPKRRVPSSAINANDCWTIDCWLPPSSSCRNVDWDNCLLLLSSCLMVLSPLIPFNDVCSCPPTSTEQWQQRNTATMIQILIFQMNKQEHYGNPFPNSFLKFYLSAGYNTQFHAHIRSIWVGKDKKETSRTTCVDPHEPDEKQAFAYRRVFSHSSWLGIKRETDLFSDAVLSNSHSSALKAFDVELVELSTTGSRLTEQQQKWRRKDWTGAKVSVFHYYWIRRFFFFLLFFSDDCNCC